MESRDGARWVYDTTDPTLKEKLDANGNVTAYDWKTETLTYWGETFTVFCPTKITFPGNRELTFTYDTSTGKKHLCTKVTSPSGFDLEYTYTNNLLTGIHKSNGQVLSYAYHTTTHPDDGSVAGWLTKITYANGGEVNVTYNGQFANPEAVLRVTRVTGPEGFDQGFSHSETPVSGQKPDVTLVMTDSLSHGVEWGVPPGGHWPRASHPAGGSPLYPTLPPSSVFNLSILS